MPLINTDKPNYLGGGNGPPQKTGNSDTLQTLPGGTSLQPVDSAAHVQQNVRILPGSFENIVIDPTTGGSATAGSWTTVVGPGVFNAQPGQLKFLVDSRGGPVRINLAGPLVDEQVLTVKDQYGQFAAGGTCTVYPPAGVTSIEDPSNPGNQAPSALCDVQGQVASWQYIASLNELVQIGS